MCLNVVLFVKKKNNICRRPVQVCSNGLVVYIIYVYIGIKAICVCVLKVYGKKNPKIAKVEKVFGCHSSPSRIPVKTKVWTPHDSDV